ncbi:SDR family oxidoreductase [Glutamicibacter sp. MNS18]|uniref:SDR family oxidoreductase n=1 Tax=Glutamicibacter sp. MNS18 TaxID=2989817 RepID=UPI00223635AA|nr:SDR family oxidoreductase [Glutamicibacter sp. MNS18]MCW4465140.1 SDR family oxidoreductase [Glutamicibacter sp. MNS18]
MKIAVAGGTGTIGQLVVAAADEAGHETVVLARSTGTDLRDARELEPKLRGVDTVIDVTSTGTMSTARAVEFFGTVTSNLLRAGRAAGVGHHVALSIVGALEVNASYYAGKAAQERMLLSQPGGYSLLRTTQFHEFAAQMVQRMGRGPVQLAPIMLSQPIAGTEVADELIRLAESGPEGEVADLAGPREEKMPRMVKAYREASGSPARVLAVPVPGAMGKAMRDGSLLAGQGARLRTLTFDDWLAGQQH